jgi:hypothetical protein
LFTHRWLPLRYLQVKPKIRILILGSYENSALKRLEMLKKFLLTKGYMQTCLVKEFKHPVKHYNEPQPAYNLRKSEYWIPKADIPIFVFFPYVDNTGVGYELKHLCDNHYDMVWRSIVGTSIKPASKISSLICGLILRWSEEIQQVFFNTDNELQEGVRGALTNLLEKLYFHIIDRQVGEWEISK